jgi:hypothetical protein
MWKYINIVGRGLLDESDEDLRNLLLAQNS